MAHDDEQHTLEEEAAYEEAPPASSTAPAMQRPARLPWKKRLAVTAAGLLGVTAIRSLACTYRYRVHHRDQVFTGRTIPQRLHDFRGTSGGPLLFALWHGSCFPILSYWRDRGMCVVTSRSTDGQILARILKGLGCTTVNGSSSRGGTRALIDLTHVVRGGADAAIAVDGPRGPALEVKPGLLLLAKLTGRPIIPLAATSKRYYQFQSWDSFRLPLPFTTAAIIAGEPIEVPSDANHERLESLRVGLQHTLRELQSTIDDRIQPKVWKRADSARTKRRKAMTQAVTTK